MSKIAVTTSNNSINASKCQLIERRNIPVGTATLSNFGHVRIPFGVPSKYGDPGIKSSRALNDDFDQSASR